MYDQDLVRRIGLVWGLQRYLEDHRRLLAYIRENMPSDVPALKFTEEEVKDLEALVAKASSAQTQGALDKIIADINSRPGFYGIAMYVELPKTKRAKD